MAAVQVKHSQKQKRKGPGIVMVRGMDYDAWQQIKAGAAIKGMKMPDYLYFCHRAAQASA